MDYLYEYAESSKDTAIRLIRIAKEKYGDKDALYMILQTHEIFEEFLNVNPNHSFSTEYENEVRILIPLLFKKTKVIKQFSVKVGKKDSKYPFSGFNTSWRIRLHRSNKKSEKGYYNAHFHFPTIESLKNAWLNTPVKINLSVNLVCIEEKSELKTVYHDIDKFLPVIVKGEYLYSPYEKGKGENYV